MRHYGFTKTGEKVNIHTLQDSLIKVDIIDYGATIAAIKVNNGKKMIDVALGYNNLSGYEKGTSFYGATIARVANRIRNGKFNFFGQECSLPINNEPNCLHGGGTINKKVFNLVHSDESSVTLQYISPHLEDGFLHELDIRVKFSVQNGELAIEYFALSQQDTVFAPTNHTYFDLSGECGSVECGNYCHELKINADSFLAVDSTLIPTHAQSVSGTPFDFTSYKKIGEDIQNEHPQLKIAGGYDHNFCLNSSLAASARCNKSGIQMDVYTDQRGVQFYSGNFLNGSPHAYRSAFCLETQSYPDSVNQNLDAVLLKGGKQYKSRTSYKFTLI